MTSLASSAAQGSPLTAHGVPVHTLLFDFGGTLDSDGIPWKERFFRLWTEGERIPRERFDRAFYAADDALVGSVTPELSLDETVSRLARGIAEGLGATDATLPGRLARRFCDESRQSLSASGAILGRLCRRFRLGVVSNFYGNLASVCREAGLEPFLSAAVDSAAVGSCKPDSAIFRAALDRLGADAAGSVFVGDSLERDMAGARAVGMRHVLVAGGSDGAARGGCCPEDPVIRGLSELEALL
jgi:putative hydrolase of the HAD superfamily